MALWPHRSQNEDPRRFVGPAPKDAKYPLSLLGCIFVPVVLIYPPESSRPVRCAVANVSAITEQDFDDIGLPREKLRLALHVCQNEGYGVVVMDQPPAKLLPDLDDLLRGEFRYSFDAVVLAMHAAAPQQISTTIAEHSSDEARPSEITTNELGHSNSHVVAEESPELPPGWEINSTSYVAAAISSRVQQAVYSGALLIGPGGALLEERTTRGSTFVGMRPAPSDEEMGTWTQTSAIWLRSRPACVWAVIASEDVDGSKVTLVSASGRLLHATVPGFGEDKTAVVCCGLPDMAKRSDWQIASVPGDDVVKIQSSTKQFLAVQNQKVVTVPDPVANWRIVWVLPVSPHAEISVDPLEVRGLCFGQETVVARLPCTSAARARTLARGWLPALSESWALYSEKLRCFTIRRKASECAPGSRRGVDAPGSISFFPSSGLIELAETEFPEGVTSTLPCDSLDLARSIACRYINGDTDKSAMWCKVRKTIFIKKDAKINNPLTSVATKNPSSTTFFAKATLKLAPYAPPHVRQQPIKGMQSRDAPGACLDKDGNIVLAAKEGHNATIDTLPGHLLLTTFPLHDHISVSPTKIPNIQSTHGPSLINFCDVVILGCKGKSATAYIGKCGNECFKVPVHGGSATCPGLCVFEDELWMFTASSEDGVLHYARFKEPPMTRAVAEAPAMGRVELGAKTWVKPSAASFRDKLVLCWERADRNFSLAWYTAEEDRFFPSRAVETTSGSPVGTSLKHSGGPCLVVSGDWLRLYFRGDSQQNPGADGTDEHMLVVEIDKPPTFADWTGPRSLTALNGMNTSRQVAAVALPNGSVQLFFRGRQSSNVWAARDVLL